MLIILFWLLFSVFVFWQAIPSIRSNTCCLFVSHRICSDCSSPDLIVRSRTLLSCNIDALCSAVVVLTLLMTQVPAHVSVDDTDVCVGLKKNMDFEGFDVKVICMCFFFLCFFRQVPDLYLTSLVVVTEETVACSVSVKLAVKRTCLKGEWRMSVLGKDRRREEG